MKNNIKILQIYIIKVFDDNYTKIRNEFIIKKFIKKGVNKKYDRGANGKIQTTKAET